MPSDESRTGRSRPQHFNVLLNVLGCTEPIAYFSCGNACPDLTSGDIMSQYRSCCNDRTVTDGYAAEYDRITADPDVIAD